jgi:ferritin-like metal-binding protein YciE
MATKATPAARSTSTSARTTGNRATVQNRNTTGKRSASNTNTSALGKLEKVVSNAKNTLKSTYNDLTGNERPNDTKLQAFFLDCLKDIYWAEKALLKAIPKMKKAATTTQLKTAFQDHLGQTQTHVARLEEVFKILGVTPRAKKCEAMDGIIKEGEDIIGETEAGTATRDVGLILAAQKVEHYEIATYGGLAQLAKTLGNEKAAKLLGQTLAEEKQTDEKLTLIAEKNVNYSAKREGK